MQAALVQLRQGTRQIPAYLPVRAAMLGAPVHRDDGYWVITRVVGVLPRGWLKRQREGMERA